MPCLAPTQIQSNLLSEDVGGSSVGSFAPLEQAFVSSPSMNRFQNNLGKSATAYPLLQKNSINDQLQSILASPQARRCRSPAPMPPLLSDTNTNANIRRNVDEIVGGSGGIRRQKLPPPVTVEPYDDWAQTPIERSLEHGWDQLRTPFNQGLNRIGSQFHNWDDSIHQAATTAVEKKRQQQNMWKWILIIILVLIIIYIIWCYYNRNKEVDLNVNVFKPNPSLANNISAAALRTNLFF